MSARGWLALTALLLASCGGGGGSGGDGGTATPAPTPPPVTATPGYAFPPQEALSASEVGQVVAQGAAEAQARGRPATIAVVDRVGNVLAVFRMPGAALTATIPLPPSGIAADAQGLTVPAAAAAIAKAVTGAYLSSAGNAFSTRTASMIVQQHFPPAAAATGLESGPLFGVQFSQLPCSDLATRFTPGAPPIGPKRSPLGLSADPGGFPLYKSGVLVGGVGVIGDGVYGFDPDVSDIDADDDEFAGLAATVGHDAPEAIRADRIPVDGTTLRFSDATATGLRSIPTAASLAATNGTLVAVRGYHDGAAVLAGAAYGSEASGLRPATAAEFAAADAFVLSDGAGANRFPIRAGSALAAAEVRTLLEQAFAVARRARAQIRRPLDSRAQVSIAVVDTEGAVLGLVRSPDAPIFGTDVALQKARGAAFFSSAAAGATLAADPSADVRQFVDRARAFLEPAALTGATAFSDRATGNLARPYFPDGQVGQPPGPFARAIAQFNPFSTGLQSALIVGNLAQHLAFVGGAAEDTPRRCGASPRLANGIQIFPGSVPIYRGSTLVGGIGVSGDGIDQDDMVAFLGLANAGGSIANAPAAIRADRIVVQGVRLRYVNCPFAPFLDTADQNVCAGK